MDETMTDTSKVKKAGYGDLVKPDRGSREWCYTFNVGGACYICRERFALAEREYAAQEARKAVVATTQAALDRARVEQAAFERLSTTPPTTFLGKPAEYWSRLERLARAEQPSLVRRAEAPSRLFVGGPKNGERVYTGDLQEYRVPEMPQPGMAYLALGPTAAPLYRTHRYLLRELALNEGAVRERVYTYEGLV